MHLFRSRRVGGCFWFHFLCHTITNTFRTQQKYRDQVPSRLVTAAPFVCPTIPSIKSNFGSNDNHHSVAFCKCSLVPLVFFSIFGLHFRIVAYLRRNRLPDTMLYMAAIAKTAVNSNFDLCCRPLSAQRAGMANTRDAPTNLMSEVCMEHCTLYLLYFR